MGKKKAKTSKDKEKKLWLHQPYRQPPCKHCPALKGGVCDCARKKQGK